MGKSSKKWRRAGQSASALEALEASPTGVESDVSASSPPRGAPSSPPIKPHPPASDAPTPPSQQKYTNDPDDPSTWSKSKKKRMKQKRKKEAIAAANARKRLAAAEEEGELERKAAKFAAQSGPGKRPGGANGDVTSPSKPPTQNNGEDKGNNKRPPAADDDVVNSPKKKKKKKSDKRRTLGAEEGGATPADMAAQKADGTSKKKKQKRQEASPERSSQSAPKPKKQKLDYPDGKKKQHDNSQTKANGNGAQERPSKPNLSAVSESTGEPTGSDKPMASEGETSPKKKKRKKKRTSTPEKNNGTKLPPQPKQDDATADERNNNGPSDSNTPAPSPRKITLPRQSRMSSLQKAFLERLTSSRFRELNEELYTQPSSNSFEHFTDNPELFEQYHVGFRRQAAEWPVNPVDVIYKKIVRDCSSERKGNGSGGGGGGKQLVVADLGCGDAKLAERLLALRVGKDGHTLEQAATKKKKKGQSNEQRQCPFEVHSFDLVSGGNKLVTAADMANVPLDDESVDVAVYCLALMGTNVADFVREAWRVLRVGGVLRVAEVRSRFETAAPEGDANIKGGGKRGKLSNGKKHRTKPHHGPRSSGSGNGDEDGAPKPLMLLDEFHSLMKRCGFECTDMDRSNKMFLFMDFAKAKGGPGVSETESFTAKPCIYKRR